MLPTKYAFLVEPNVDAILEGIHSAVKVISSFNTVDYFIEFKFSFIWST